MIKLKKIRFDKKGFEAFLSPLESDVLRLLWKLEQSRVREIHNRLKKNRKVALTSVAVILDRLHQKGIVSRDVEKGRGGGHYIYYPKASRQEFEESVVENTVNTLMNNFGPIAASYFYKRFSRKKK